MATYAGAARQARRSRRTEEAASLAARVDWLLMGAALGLVVFGLWAIAGITRHDIPGDETYYVVRQAFFAGAGLVALVLLALAGPAVLAAASRVLYGLLLGLLVLVLVVGAAIRGSQRWIDLGFFQFQPSEFGKVMLAAFLAAFIAERGRRIADVRTVATAIGLTAIPTALVFVQPDFGTALVYFAVLAGALFVAGTRWLHLAVLTAFACLAVVGLLWLLPAAGFTVLKPYQYERITAFADPQNAPPETTYNVDQSITAIGSGRFDGRGVEGATQTNLEFLPEHATDFVFASLAEQRGFVGAGALLLLYLLLLWRGLRVVTIAGDAFSAIVAGAIVVSLLFSIFINVGMTMGIAPVTGIPLPFVSVGGSSMLANLAAVGVLLGIHARSSRRRAG
ncbi:MAG TPA: rod shape-determining protein RodA [Gaiellaceae bacterium]|nr:rod shape-determining protein RodA [Gaiellaceae bacterium]